MARLETRIRLWLVIGACVLLAAAVLKEPLVRLLARAYAHKDAGNALSEKETEFLASWRELDFQPPVAMESIPFTINAEKHAPETEYIRIENTSAQVIRNIWFFRRGMPNFYSATTLVESVTHDLKTDTEKVIALWSLFPRYYYNFYPADSGGLLNDPSTMFAVFGTAQCSYAVSILETLCQMVGCETRPIGIAYQGPDKRQIAHLVMEVLADEKWIYLDPDGHCAYRSADGHWAGAQDLIANPELVLSVRHAYYDTRLLADAFAKGQLIFHEQHPNKFRNAIRQRDPSRFPLFRHVMRYDLLPGERVNVYPHRKGKFYSRRGGPPPLYGNGVAVWEYRPGNFSRIPSGIMLENLKFEVKDNRLVLTPQARKQKAHLIVPITNPYLMVGAKVRGEIQSEAPVRISLLPFAKPTMARRRGWQSLAGVSGEFEVEFEAQFHKHSLFGYALKFEIPKNGTVIKSLRIETDLQCAPKALVHLVSGQNDLVLYSERAVIGKQVDDGTKNTVSVAFDNGLHLTFGLGAQIVD